MKDRIIISYSLLFLCVVRTVVFSNSIIFCAGSGEDCFDFFIREQQTFGGSFTFAEQFQQSQRLKELLLQEKAFEEVVRFQQATKALQFSEEVDKGETKPQTALSFPLTFTVFVPEGNLTVEPPSSSLSAFFSLLL